MFCADAEYKVMPVTKGTKLVLQYDVQVIGEELPPSPFEGDEESLKNVARRVQRPVIGKELPPPPFEDDEESLENVARRVQRLDSIITYRNHNDTSTQGVINEIQELHKRGTSMVSFPLYRRASVKRENFKKNDSLLFNALKGLVTKGVQLVLQYDVEVVGEQHPVE
jgi:hypothetical protein